MNIYVNQPIKRKAVAPRKILNKKLFPMSVWCKTY